MTGPPLLGEDEPPPVIVENPDGTSAFLILCDHAGNRLPRVLGSLGLSERDLQRHIAWDIGAGEVASELGRLLRAAVVKQRYSRLAVDCNRAPEHLHSIAECSETTIIPGNVGLESSARQARLKAIFDPYHAAIDRLIEQRVAQHQATIPVAIHSFTPVFDGIARPWQAGVLYEGDARLGRALRDLLIGEGLVIGDNEPYRLSAAEDFTIPYHAERRRLPYAEIELRQDLVGTGPSQRQWAARLARLLPAAAALALR